MFYSSRCHIIILLWRYLKTVRFYETPTVLPFVNTSRCRLNGLGYKTYASFCNKLKPLSHQTAMPQRAVGSPRNTSKNIKFVSYCMFTTFPQGPYSVYTTFPQRLYSVHDVFIARKQLLQRVHSAHTARSRRAHSVLTARTQRSHGDYSV